MYTNYTTSSSLKEETEKKKWTLSILLDPYILFLVNFSPLKRLLPFLKGLPTSKENSVLN